MYADIIFPNNNEEEFIEMARRLGYSSLYFVYDYKNKTQIDTINEKFNTLKKKATLRIFLGLKVRPNEILKLKKEVDLRLCESSEKNRWVIENTKGVMLYNLEYQSIHDFMHHRNSGLNHILCIFAHEHNVAIGISFSSLMRAPEKSKSVLIGRISQNIRLCRKYKVQLILGSFASSAYEMRSPYDLQSLGDVLGMQPGDAKKAISYYQNKNL